MTQRQQLVLGLAGWSGSGKTTLALKLIKRLRKKGLTVSTIKHAHHSFDVDVPGKDSYRHRQAGAGQVLVSSCHRWALMTELNDAPELTLDAAMEHLKPCDLVLIEGFKSAFVPKLEIHRPALGKPLLCHSIPEIVAIASDADVTPSSHAKVLDLNDLDALESWVLDFVAWHS